MFGIAKPAIVGGASCGSTDAILASVCVAGKHPDQQRGFYQVCAVFIAGYLREGVINADPSVHLESPRQGRSLPKSLSEDDVERLLNAPNLKSDIEFRDERCSNYCMPAVCGFLS